MTGKETLDQHAALGAAPVRGDGPWADPGGQDGACAVLRLFVAGLTSRSVTAIQAVTAICETHLAGRCQLEIIDIYEHPSLARGEQILAAPTLIRTQPLPLRRWIGDLSDQECLLRGLDLKPRGPDPVVQG
jgi:circadian clock protein KaiB